MTNEIVFDPQAEINFHRQFDKYFKSNSLSEMLEGLNIARTNLAFVFEPSPILAQEESFYKPRINAVFLREDEIYKSKSKFRIHFNGLLRMSLAAATEWSVMDCLRTDGNKDRNYCSYRAVAGIRKSDGRIYPLEASDDMDLEVIEMELEDKYSADWERVKDCKNSDAWKKHGHTHKDTFVPALVRRDMIHKRKNKMKLVESGAKARVIRQLLGLQGEYSSKGQLIGMPFIFVYYVVNNLHKLLKPAIAKALPSSIDMVYGGGGSVIDHDHQTIDIDATSSPELSESSDEPPESSPEPKADEEFNMDDGPENSQTLDFENLDIEWQVKNLQQLCEKVGHNWEKYIAKAGKAGIEKQTQDWRNRCFEYLNNLTRSPK